MFQLTPPHKGRQPRTRTLERLYRFNSRPRIRGDERYANAFARTHIRFNSRPRIRGDIIGDLAFRRWVRFQLTPPHKGRLWNFGIGLPIM